MRGAAWTDEGRILLGGGGSLVSVPAAGGDATGLFKADGNLLVSNPQLLPGNSVLLTLAELRSGTARLPSSSLALERGKPSRPTPRSDAFFLLAISSS